MPSSHLRPFIMQFAAQPAPVSEVQWRYDAAKQLLEIRALHRGDWISALDSRQLPGETRITKIRTETTDDN